SSELRPVESIRLIPRSGLAKQRMRNSRFRPYLDWTWREFSKKSVPTPQLSNRVMKYLGWLEVSVDSKVRSPNSLPPMWTCLHTSRATFRCVRPPRFRWLRSRAGRAWLIGPRFAPTRQYLFTQERAALVTLQSSSRVPMAHESSPLFRQRRSRLWRASEPRPST